MAKNIVVHVRQEGLGVLKGSLSEQRNAREFGLQLFDAFLHAFEARSDKPSAMVFYTDGVKLVGKGSIVVPSLKLLEAMGVRMVACGTCLKRFGLIDEVAVGEVGTMSEIVKLLSEADTVITA